MRLLLLLAVLVCPSPLLAKSVDLSNMTDNEGHEYNIAFCARPSPGSLGLPGHMFVSFSEANAAGERTFLAIGHTVGTGVSPAEGAWSYFGAPVAGLLKPEMYSAIGEACLDVKVNKADYDRAYLYTADPLAGLGLTDAGAPVLQAYRLGENDCMTYALNVAGVLKARGLVVPNRGATELPLDYMQRLIASN
ncbi:hypothetical protein [Rhizobium ruizarguesonis]|uniref:Uncharacterized protein n=1 Tax=Rhizobium ruizarguesonis TaxID=2081791 RepID=A0AAE8Q5C9_9HYPH|nr:hypothetical protein [Rhizobium ruizarguesonis]TBC12702.1 hypothetical protein ELH35_38005 [Rhizobium ruizarguesonis]TBF00948.1 hypothetical protein ELG94_39425 [Rhizobium ruizarguesonis]TCA23030.1 hypothetical protein E0H66_36730 [Rhizobium leguminosarum bv. viciae]